MSDPFRLASPSIPPRPGQQPGEAGLIGELQSEVSLEAAPLLTFVLTHIKAIVSVVLLFVFCIVGYGAYQWNTSRNLQQARLEMGRILITPASTAKIAALEAFLPKAPVAMRTGVLLEIAATAVGVDDFVKAGTTYGQIYSADPKGALGIVSALNQADLLQRENKLAEAISLLESLETSAPDAIKPMVREELASVAEQAGQTAKAIKTYERLLAPGSGTVPGGMESGYYKSKIATLTARKS